jgi:oligopeptide transport system permease protein
MAAVDNSTGSASPASQIAKLDTKPKGANLWSDAWRRLRRNKLALLGLFIIITAIFVAIFADQLAPYTYYEQVLANHDMTPEWVTRLFPSMIPEGQPGGYVPIGDQYPLGADKLGRDLLSRIIYGTRVSLLVAFVGPLAALAVGLTIGMIAGYFGGRVDNLLMRFADVMYAFPTLLFVILLLSFFRSSVAQPEAGTFAAALADLDRNTGGMIFVIIGIGVTSWMNLARLVRGQILSLREKEFVEAARSLGVGGRGIMLRHMLPNILGPIIVAETLTIPTYISFEAFLSFIGLGVQQPTPSWGSMIAEGREVIVSFPNQAIFPAVALFLVMFAFNFLGDGLRDALDPRMRGVD